MELLNSTEPVVAQSPETVYEIVRSRIIGTRTAHFFKVTSAVQATMRLQALPDFEFIALTERRQVGRTALAKEWLRTCHKDHSACRELKDGDSNPTRLLALDQHLIKVVDGSTLPYTRYVALSYCWGKTPQAFKLNQDTKQQLNNGIRCELLSPSIRDAIDFCRQIQVDYLWVDALCIMQGELNKDDWNREAAKIHHIYGNAYVTLSLSSASSAMQGYSAADDLPDFTIDPRGCRILDMLPVPTRKTLAHIRTQTPLAKRGWIFQEELLSPRIIYWSNQGLFWSCCELTEAENGTAKAGGDNLFPQLDIPAVMDPHEFSRAQDPLSLWDDMITAYSERDFAREEDRLPAVAGLAAIIQQRTGEEYLAGLWKSRMPAQLLWVVHSALRNLSSQRPSSDFVSEQFKPPSWSWAVIHSGRKVDMPKQGSARAILRGSSMVDQRSLLHLYGRMRKLTSGLDRLMQYPTEQQKHATGLRYPELQHKGGVWFADQAENSIVVCREWTKPIVIHVDNELPSAFEELVCFEINYIGLLLLQPSNELGRLTYSRIGCAVSHRDAGFFDQVDQVSIDLT